MFRGSVAVVVIFYLFTPASHLGVPVSWLYCSCLRTESVCIAARSFAARSRFQTYLRLRRLSVSSSSHTVVISHLLLPPLTSTCMFRGSIAAVFASSLSALQPDPSQLDRGFRPIFACDDCLCRFRHTRSSSRISRSSHSPGRASSWP
jgi:hypothetical protein